MKAKAPAAAKATTVKPVNGKPRTEPEFGRPRIEEFRGHKILNLQPNKERFAVSLGLSKLKVVLEHLDAVKRFVESNGTSV